MAALMAVFKARGCAVEIPAIMNDTVATLVALRYSEPDTRIGIILGTGTNAAYQEQIKRYVCVVVFLVEVVVVVVVVMVVVLTVVLLAVVIAVIAVMVVRRGFKSTAAQWQDRLPPGLSRPCCAIKHSACVGELRVWTQQPRPAWNRALNPGPLHVRGCRIETLPSGFKGRSDSMLINTEWGDFFSPALPCCEEDAWIDASSVNPGHGRLEKVRSAAMPCLPQARAGDGWVQAGVCRCWDWAKVGKLE